MIMAPTFCSMKRTDREVFTFLQSALESLNINNTPTISTPLYVLL